MSLGNKLMALGQWIEKRFPEKLTAAEVYSKIEHLETAVADAGRRVQSQEEFVRTLVVRIMDLEHKAETFNSDINKTKVMLLTQRQTR